MRIRTETAFDHADDNCPNEANRGEEDADDDGLGDLCDNCVNDPNPDQTDTNGDGIGDACEAYADGDGIPDEYDLKRATRRLSLDRPHLTAHTRMPVSREGGADRLVENGTVVARFPAATVYSVPPARPNEKPLDILDSMRPSCPLAMNSRCVCSCS